MPRTGSVAASLYLPYSCSSNNIICALIIASNSGVTLAHHARQLRRGLRGRGEPHTDGPGRAAAPARPDIRAEAEAPARGRVPLRERTRAEGHQHRERRGPAAATASDGGEGPHAAISRATPDHAGRTVTLRPQADLLSHRDTPMKMDGHTPPTPP
jgi:hypothetical protein